MKAAVRMPCRLPALALIAALAAQAAWAGDAPVMPFPGASVPGTSVSGTSVPGGAVEERQESFPEPAAEASPGAAPAAGAEAAGVAAPAAGAGPSGVAAPGGAVAAKEPAMPARGSRLLRALAEALKAPASLDDGAAGGVPGEAARLGAPRVFAAEGCPRALLRRLLAGATDDAGALTALGIEREILTLCRERQEVVAGLFETEARLRELRAPPPPNPALTAVQTPNPLPDARESAASRSAPVSPLRLALSGPARQANETDPGAEDPGPEDARAGDTRARDGRPEEAQPPRYAWFSIIGTAGALRAGITDGTGVWFVREGDPLPGGATVAAIAGRPPAVRIREGGETGEATPLPYSGTSVSGTSVYGTSVRARPGGGR